VFKVAGKMFAVSWLDAEELGVGVKCERRLAENLVAIHPEVLPGYHLNERRALGCDGEATCR
jgi:predicted DNA-binding protein (MmcQ/YjbR family)